MVKHRICHGFWCSLKNSSKWSQKIHFLAHLRRFFIYVLLRPMNHASIFCQIESLMKIPNCGKFHEYSICGCQVINFQSVLYQFSIHQMVLFRGFTQRYPKFALLVQLWLPVSLWRWPKNFSHRAIQISQNQAHISSCFSRKNLLFFALFWLFLAGNQPRSKVKGPELKFKIVYFTDTVPGHHPVKKVWFLHFPVMRL